MINSKSTKLIILIKFLMNYKANQKILIEFVKTLCKQVMKNQ